MKSASAYVISRVMNAYFRNVNVRLSSDGVDYGFGDIFGLQGSMSLEKSGWYICHVEKLCLY